MEKSGFYRAVVDENIYSNSIYFELTQDFTIYIVDSYKTDSIRISEKNVKEVCVYDIMGSQILSEKVRKDENVISISLDHSNQIFIIKVVLDDGRVISKKIF
jgi:protease II